MKQKIKIYHLKNGLYKKTGQHKTSITLKSTMFVLNSNMVYT
jgi:hypothetical protein